MKDLTALLGQYPILVKTARYLSAIDLLNVAKTCHDLHASIIENPRVFERLKRENICDGSGLKARQEYTGLYQCKVSSIWGGAFRQKGELPTKCLNDEEVEVRLYNLECDEAGALPCVKCGVNVCEECRFVPRVREASGYSSWPYPHYNPSKSNENLVCYCWQCDAEVKEKTGGGLCKCDQYTRWICLRCRCLEREEWARYDKSRTGMADYVDDDDGYKGMVLADGQFATSYWCPCGEPAPSTGNVRCMWCKKRHRTRLGGAEPRTRVIYPKQSPWCIPAFGDEH